MKNYMSEETYKNYLEKQFEQREKLEALLLDSEKEDSELVSAGKSFKNSLIEIESSLLNRLTDIIKNSVIINEKNFEYLRKEKGIGFTYELLNEKGEVLKYTVGGIEPDRENFISYISPLAKELFYFLKYELDFEEGNYENLDLKIELNGKEYKIISVNKIKKIS